MFRQSRRDHDSYAEADTAVCPLVLAMLPVSPSVIAGFSPRVSPLVVASAGVSAGSGTLPASLVVAEEEPF